MEKEQAKGRNYFDILTNVAFNGFEYATRNIVSGYYINGNKIMSTCCTVSIAFTKTPQTISLK